MKDKIKIIVSSLGCLGLALSYNSCDGVGSSFYYNTSESSQSEPIASNKFKVFSEKYCNQCHTSTEPILSNSFRNIENIAELVESQFVVPGAPEQSYLFQRVVSSSEPMPPTGFPQPSEAEVLELESYIFTLNLNGEQPEEPEENPQDIFDPTYSSIKENIINNYCLSCHSPSLQRGGVNLNSYESVMATVTPGSLDSVFYTSVESGNMPKSQSLSTQQIKQIESWILQGAQNN